MMSSNVEDQRNLIEDRSTELQSRAKSFSLRLRSKVGNALRRSIFGAIALKRSLFVLSFLIVFRRQFGKFYIIEGLIIGKSFWNGRVQNRTEIIQKIRENGWQSVYARSYTTFGPRLHRNQKLTSLRSMVVWLVCEPNQVYSLGSKLTRMILTSFTILRWVWINCDF